MAEKDKLAELYDFLKHDVEVSFLDGNVIDVAMDVITKLIEKIKELENIIYQDARQGVLEGLYEENKRYREVVTQAISDLENECLWDALVKLKALEESE